VPAAAVIPAPIAYIKVVVVKKLVVGSQGRSRRSLAAMARALRGVVPLAGPLKKVALNRVACSSGRRVYFEKIRVFKAGTARLYNGAWNNGIGPRILFCWFLELRGND